jgi:hypothetical protein
VEGSCEHGNGPSGSIKYCEILDLHGVNGNESDKPEFVSFVHFLLPFPFPGVNLKPPLTTAMTTARRAKREETRNV